MNIHQYIKAAKKGLVSTKDICSDDRLNIVEKNYLVAARLSCDYFPNAAAFHIFTECYKSLSRGLINGTQTGN